MKRARKPKWSFMVIRGAEQSVKQFRVSRKSVVAAPAAAILAVSGCVAGLQIKAAYEAQALEDELDSQSAGYANAITGKDETIQALQQQIALLSAQAEEMKTKVANMQELENKLKQFINQYGNRAGLSAYDETSPDGLSAAQDGSAGTNAPYGAEALAGSTSAHLQNMNQMLSQMEQIMGKTLQQAVQTRQAADAYPSSWPTKSHMLTSSFGYRKDPINGSIKFHAGIDIAGKSGDTVFSAADGIVTETGSGGSEGNYIVIDHGNGLQSEYMHLEKIEATQGDTVVRGEKIGLMGSSGRSTGTHLHFQIMEKNTPVDPLPYLNGPAS
ncbi:M23 family metallopeptidase [Paenibacillus protaetiae]|uniref:M23 family peptidase n=1 Tax=Paenibacillus protaetiae TaxID=2509456 RepID=A0A4P6EXL8_9BACL|nr:M23 family metallopeptidase [Paenibacillus protaetiae]QAY68150.1 M23 family peptidase [Paenibacillus protaetiae]